MTPSQANASVARTSTSKTRRPRGKYRQGTIIVFVALLLGVLMAMLAFSIDVGYMYTVKTQLRRSVDSAALAGAGALVEGQAIAEARVVEYLVRNPIGSASTTTVPTNNTELQLQMNEFMKNHKDDLQVELGHWDPATRQMVATNVQPSTISVSMSYPNQKLFFAPVLGKDFFTVSAEATAMYQPRDIVLVLDLSASMNDDSEFGSISKLGQTMVEANLAQMYQEFGSPNWGTLPSTPQYITVQGQPANTSTNVPHITVEYRNTSVYVTSTLNLSQVKLQKSSGTTTTFSGLSSQTGTFSYSNSTITGVWVKSGSNYNGSNPDGEFFNFSSTTINSTIKSALGISNVACPYSGSWDNWIDYVKSSGNKNDSAGYRYKFGQINLFHYMLEQKPSTTECPDLWKVSAQPVTALKDAVDVFLDFISEVDANDRVALAVYNASNGNGKLETGLTEDLSLVSTLTRHRQAGHYHDYTNIGAGMSVAIQELDANARLGAFKLIVLLTDGNANWYNGQVNVSGAVSYVNSQAALAAAKKYPIITISLGAAADTALMQSVADVTKGEHFNIPGGQTVQGYTNNLKDVFEDIAKDRPLKLVK